MADKKHEMACREASKDNAVLQKLAHLPRHMLHHYDQVELAPLVLHTLGHNLGLKRASYLVDNPDFDCIKGVAGYCHRECDYHKSDLWSDPHAFSQDMEQAPFHRKMRCYMHTSMKQRHDDYVRSLAALGKELGIENPDVRVWDLRHDNHGILIFEKNDACPCKEEREMIDSAIALLGLCPLRV